MKKILLDENLRFFKGNMHCHSNLSDGKMSPEELKVFYKARGYSFLAITDHDHINEHSYLHDADFITITSAEYAVKEFPEQSTLVNQTMKCCHLNLYAKKQGNTQPICYSPVYDKYSKGERREALMKHYTGYERKYCAEGINDLIRIANENGFFVAYNHPRWSLENYKQYSAYEGLWGVEVFNTACHYGGIYEYDINVHDDFLRDGKRLCVTVGDDNHSEKTAGVAFVSVNAESLSYENIVDGLLAGRFYASTGPEIYALWIEGNEVHIKTSGAKMIGFSTLGRRHGAKRAPEGELLTSATFEILPEDGYFRLFVEDAQGRRADTQAYFTEEFFA